MSNANPPSPLPLREFEAAIQADQRVLGMLYTGSLGRGTAGRFSDLDMEMWLTDAASLRLAFQMSEKEALLPYL